MEQPVLDSLQKQPNTQTGYTFCSRIPENKRSKLREKLHSVLMVMDYFVLLLAFLFKYSNCVVEQHHKMCCILWKHRGDYDHCQLWRSVGGVMIIFLKHGNRTLTTDEWLPSNIKTSSAKQSKSNTITTTIFIALFLVPMLSHPAFLNYTACNNHYITILCSHFLASCWPTFASENQFLLLENTLGLFQTHESLDALTPMWLVYKKWQIHGRRGIILLIH